MATVLLAAAASWLNGAVLTPNSVVFEKIAPGQDFACTLTVPAGQAAELSIVEKQAFAGMIAIRAEDGTEVHADLHLRTPGAKRLTLVSGRFTIRFMPVNHSLLERIFELHTSELHPATEADRSRAVAERLLGEGEQAARKFEPGARDEALRKFAASLAEWKRLGDKLQQAQTLLHMADVWQGRQEMEQMREALHQALELSRAVDDSDGVGWALIGLSKNATDVGQSEEGVEYADQARQTMDSNGDLRGQAWARMARGGSINGTSDVEKERANYLEALVFARRAGDSILEADAHNMLGVLEMRAGNYKAAEETYLEALRIDREENDPARTARLLSNLGSMHGNIGEYREALQYLEQALPIRKELGGPQQYGNTIYNIGYQHAQLGEYQKALDEYTAALAEFRRATYPYGEAYALQGLADVCIALHDDAKAEGYLRQGLAARRAIPDRQGEATLLTRLGALTERRGQADEAMRLYRQSLKINQSGGFHAAEVDSRDYIAEALVSREPRAALNEVTQSIGISRKFGYKQREGFELHVEGLALRRLKDDAGAREAFEKALDIRHSEGAAQQEAQTLLELARLDRDESRLAQAEAHITSAIDLIESLRSNIGSRESRMRVATSSRGYYDLAIDVAMKLQDPARALELSERARARSLLDLLSEAKIDFRRGVDPALLSNEKQVQELLDGKHERYMQLLGASHMAASEAAARREVDQLVVRYEAIEAEIRARSPRYAAMAQARPITVAEIQSQLLNPDTQLLEFWLGEERGYEWIVSKEECQGFELPARSAVEGLAGRAYRALTARNLPAPSSPEEYGKRLTAAKDEFESTSGQLSRVLLGPVAPAMLSHKLWIVSDGALQYLPFAALPLPGKKLPLVSLYEITALPSASAVAAIRRDLGARPPARESVAIFADPVFRADDPRVLAGMRRAQADAQVTRAAEEAGVADLPRLSFSRAEATAIAALLPPGGTWRQFDFDASLSGAKKPELGRYGIVHFATHALLNSRHPELSAIVLSTVDGHGRPRDGLLRLHEIYNLKLQADLVVLSGCQTALGLEVRSEGLIGLTRGFMYAGSPQVLASLWSVRDSATAEFMRRFYEGVLRRHLTPAAALRETQLSIMRDPRWKDPYDWAAFTLQGTR